MTSKISSIPRRHVLWLVLTLLIGWIVSGWIHTSATNIDKNAWSGFASVLASASASMVSLTTAMTALLYALLGTPLIKFLHEKGALNRVLFDLMASAFIWLVALMASIFSAHPSIDQSALLMRIAAMCAIAGAFHFLPIGYAFWRLLKSSDLQKSKNISHNFREPTSLD